MELTPEKIKELLNGLLLNAKHIRAGIPYSKIDSFPNVVIMFGPNLEPATLPITWKGEGEKYAKMEAVSKVAGKTFAQAVALISDTRWVDEDRAVKILGIPPSAESGVEAFQDNYKRVVSERYRGYLGNAPRELYKEAVMIAMKGPRIGGIRTLSAPYEEGPKDTIRWTEPPKEIQTVHFNLLPDWWC
jgi:hypothetical protein